MAESGKSTGVKSIKDEVVKNKIKEIQDEIDNVTSATTDLGALSKVKKIQDKLNKISSAPIDDVTLSDLEYLLGNISHLEYGNLNRARLSPVVAILIGLGFIVIGIALPIFMVPLGLASLQSSDTGTAITYLVFSAIWGLGWGITGLIFIFKVRSLSVGRNEH
jgi:hypothetical protein